MKNYVSVNAISRVKHEMSPIFTKEELGLYTFLLFIFC